MRTRLRNKETGKEVLVEVKEAYGWYDELSGWENEGNFYSNDDWEEVIRA